MLDYVAADYSGAVAAGKIANQVEYKEQLAFLQDAAELCGSLPDPSLRARCVGAIAEPTRLVTSLATAEQVATACREARRRLLETSGVTLAPARAPDLAKAATLFQTFCVTCHGERGGGDGPGAAALHPPPRSFRDPAVMATLSPVRAFSALTDGISGTAMQKFTELDDDQRWSLAFFVFTLRHDEAAVRRGQVVAQSGQPRDLETLANATDEDLLASLPVGLADQARLDAVASLRANPPGDSELNADVSGAIAGLGEARAAYSAGDAPGARRHLDMAYLDGFEPVEGRLRATAPHLVTTVEDRFLALREHSRASISVGQFDSEVDALLVQLEAVQAHLKGRASPGTTFVAAFLIVVREGVESALLVLLLLGLATKVGLQADRRMVHAGWVAASVAGVGTWFISGAIVKLGGANRELVEGIVSLVAVTVLLYAGHFVLAKMDADRRIAALKRRFTAITLRRRHLLLFGLAFVAVYREAFEIVLFLRAIDLGSEGGSHVIGGGVAAGFVACVLVVTIIRRFKGLLSPALVLNSAGFLLCALAVVLAGKGVRSLQESGLIGVRSLPLPRLDWMGLYPTVQTVVAQAAVILTIVLIAVLGARRREPAATSAH